MLNHDFGGLSVNTKIQKTPDAYLAPEIGEKYSDWLRQSAVFFVTFDQQTYYLKTFLSSPSKL